MNAIKWLVIALATGFMACTIVENGEGCTEEHKQDMCSHIESDIVATWDDCYSGNDPDQDEIIQLFIDMAYQRCINNACLSEELTLECTRSTWVCIENIYGEDIMIPNSCNELLDF
jgi:hypothetical protein